MIVNNQNKRPRTPRDDAYLFMCFFAGFGLLASVWYEVAWPFFVCSGFGLAVYLVVVFRQIDHEHNLQKTRESARSDVMRIEAGKRPTQVIDAQPVLQALPDVMAPRSEMHRLNPPMVQVPTGMRNSQRFVVPQVEPEQGDGVSFVAWPEDVEALRIAYSLMLEVKPPTRKNFAACGMNSGTRYGKIRDWLVGVGLAKDFGDGNTTNWTSDAYSPDVHSEIKNYLNSPTAIAR